MMYPSPSGPTLSAEEAQALDDQYLGSDPTAYFRSRIYGLLSNYQHRNDPRPPSTGFETVLRNVAPSLGTPSPDAIELQTATDAIQLRQHVAEALLRLLHSRYSLRDPQGRSLWMQMAESPRQMPTLIKELDEWLMQEDMASVLGGMLFPVPIGTPLTQEHVRAMEHALGWITRAMLLVSSGHLDLAAAGNKIRHGAVVTAHNDRRVTFLPQHLGSANPLPISSFHSPEAVDLINNPIVEFISRPPKTKESKRGHERTVLNVDIEVVLAEAWIMALVHGALFYGAAYRHHGGDCSRIAFPQPAWVVGPSPEQLLRRKPLGFRFPLTTDPDGRVTRRSGLGEWDGGFLPLTFGEKISGVIADG